jgi:ribosomal protein S18 acetylase RimI-like enzyme
MDSERPFLSSEPGLRLGVNDSHADEIAEHLRSCDEAFVPALGTRVDVDAYARKLAERAERFEAWRDERLVGLVAVYFDTGAGKSAFVTNVSVVPDLRRFGIAERLLHAALDAARRSGLLHVALEVDARNEAAVKLYERAQFTIDGTNGSNLRLGLRLNATGAQGRAR